MTRSECLEAARQCVNGVREEQYGTPEDNFGTIAELWNAYFKRQGFDLVIDGGDVAALMILLKVARLAGGNYMEDSWVDIAGYAACGCEIGGNRVE